MSKSVKHVFGFVRKVAPSVKAADGGQDERDYDIEVVCSTGVVDRAGESIDQAGWQLAEYQANPVFLAAHMHRLDDGGSPVIGSFTSIGIEGAGEKAALVGRVRFADTELGREYRALYRDGHMRAVSVGFMPKAGENRTLSVAGKPTKVYVHTAADLYEVSAVAVPCNQEALVRMGLAGRLTRADGEPMTVEQLAEAIAKALLAVLVEPLAEAVAAKLAGGGDEESDAAAPDKGWLLEQFDEVKALLPDALGAQFIESDPLDDDEAGDAGKGQEDGSASAEFAALADRLGR